MFITQSSFSGATAMELSENNFESLFAGTDNEQAVLIFNFRTEDLLTDLLTDNCSIVFNNFKKTFVKLFFMKSYLKYEGIMY